MASGNPNIAKAGENTRWKPGQKPVNSGKPKGSKHITTWIQELLSDEEFEATIMDSKKGITEFKGAPIKAIILAQRHKAVNGDIKSSELLMKYGWTPKQEVDVTTNGNDITQPVSNDVLESFISKVKDDTKQG